MMSYSGRFGPGKRNFPCGTVTALITKGAFEQLPYHMQTAKANGIIKEEIAEMITQLAFYVGWPNAWSAFNIAKEVWDD
ncbi:4-carboxymuconolactone decarboxylase [Limosilactobacillus fermentum]|nr:4-carboxymuconolactone decarboxylase [Limosilactobacillus fermentum]